MLRALDKDNNDCLSWQTEKNKKPFSCPICKNEVILHKGNFVKHHFKHKVKNDCPYGYNETEIHYRIKKSLYEYFQNKSNCSNCEIEKYFVTVRPDVFLYINEKPIAIEIQKSKIDVSMIMHRMEEYYKLNIAVLWILPENEPWTFIQETKSDRFAKSVFGIDSRYSFHRANTWETFIHIIYDGKIYYWQENNSLLVFHFSPYLVKNNKWLKYEKNKIIDKNENIINNYGYRRYYSRYLRFISSELNELIIEKDFKITLKNETEYQNVKIPKCLIFVDKYKKWWIEK
jgi:competence protein CoiA